MDSNNRNSRIEEYREKSLRADDLATSGKTDEALTLLQECLDIASKSGDEDYRLYFQAEIIDATNSDFSKQLGLMGESFKWCEQQHFTPDYFLLRNNGVYLSKMGDNAAAIEWYDRALAIKPDDYHSLRNKGISLSILGDQKAAIELYDRALAINPDDYRCLRNKGSSLSDMGDKKTVIELVDRALAIKPDDYVSLRCKGVALSKMGDEKAAIEWYDRALAIKPDDYDSLRNKGVAFSKLGDEKAAIELYDRALAIKPDDYKSLCSKGVAFSNIDDDKTAIEWYDRALAINPDDYDSLRNKGVALARMGDEKAAIELIDRALAIKPDDYESLRNKGVVFSYKDDEKTAIEWYDHALAIKPDDYHSLRNKGVALGKLGKIKAAIELIDCALAIKPDDYESLRSKGVALSNLGDNKASIEFFDRALAINPDDYDSLRNKGVALSNMGDTKAAIEMFDRALAIKPDDYKSLRNWAVSAYKLGNTVTAYEKIFQAVKMAPDKVVDDFRLIMRLSGKNPDDEWRTLFPEEKIKLADQIDKLSDIRGFVGTIREGLGDNLRKFLKQKEVAESKENRFLQPESCLATDKSFFLVLRKWNSYTPAIPADEGERSRGGGYFIYYNNKGTIIDPGYNFIENFHDAGCLIHDIDNIVITHAHNDHTIDFESICTLVHQYNREAFKNGHKTKKIRLYLNNGAFKKFSGLLNLSDMIFETVHTLNAGNLYHVSEGMELTILPAFHDEVVARDQSVGLLFTFKFDDNIRKIVFTGDTGLFPLYKYEDDMRPDISRGELWEKYPATANNPDLLVVHIGSIKKEELEVDLDQGIDKCLYPNHLGMIGTARMITKLKPSLALVSEFGEEMRQFRLALVERIEEDVIKKALKEKPIPRIAPGDLAFMYDIAQGKFLCCAINEWTDVEEIAYQYDDAINKEDLCYFSKKILDGINPSAYAGMIKAFKQNRLGRKGMYFQIK